VNPLDEVFSIVATVCAVVIFLSGLDELFLDLNFLLRGHAREKRRLVIEEIEALPEKAIAILVPAWHEEAVIGQMLKHTIDALDYRRYHIVVGCYDNDPGTRRAVEQVGEVYPNVHAVPVGHDGPTVKADCLNAAFRGLAEVEREVGERFEIVVLHDAEDVVHPKALKVFNALFPEHDFVQIPVFPLEVRARHVTAWSYADEFSVAHLRDLQVRQEIGGIVPCAGVGCGFARDLLEELQGRHGGQVFPTWSLTEDYHTSVEIKRSGKNVFFSTVTLLRGTEREVVEEIVATREYFPSSIRRAVRQKARWMTGIIFQSLGRIKFQGSLSFLYSLLRDRKSLVTTPVGVLAFVLFLYCLARMFGDAVGAWEFNFEDVVVTGSITWWLLLFDTLFAFEYILVKMLAMERVYGVGQALLSIPRTVWGNFINFFASVVALAQYARARVTGKAVTWAKTHHAFPTQAQLAIYKRRLGDLLLENRLISALQLNEALSEQKRTGERLGRVLVRMGYLSEQEFLRYYAQLVGLEAREVDPYAVDPALLERVPEDLARRLNVFPLAEGADGLLIATDDALSPARRAEIEAILRAPIRPVLVSTPDLQFALDRAYRRPREPAAPVPWGLRLVEAALLTRKQLEQALRSQRETKRHLWEVLLEDRYLTPGDLSAPGTPFRTSVTGNPGLMRRLPSGLARTLGVVPVSLEGGELVLAVRDPLPKAVEEALTQHTGLRIRTVRAPHRLLRQAVDALYDSLGEELQLGRLFASRGLVTRDEIDVVLADPTLRGRLGDRLVAAGKITEAQLLEALAAYTGLPAEERLEPEPGLAWCLPREFCTANGIVPVSARGRTVRLALAPSFSAQGLEEARWKLAGYDLDLVLTGEGEARRVIAEVYSGGSTTEG
jgi:adsorption protein B